MPVNIFYFSIIGGKLKAEKHALRGALRSAACGGALRRCAAPSAAARRFAPPLRGATRPARCARRLFGNTKKMPCFYTPNETRGPQRARKISQEWRGLVLRAWPASAPSLSWRQPRRGGLHAGLDTTTVIRARRLRALICTNPRKTVKPSAILIRIA